jgi:hypothetical protein
VNAGKLLASLRMLHSTSLGFKETELNELQVMPQSWPSWRAVTTVTPVPKQPSALR